MKYYELKLNSKNFVVLIFLYNKINAKYTITAIIAMLLLTLIPWKIFVHELQNDTFIYRY